MIVDELVMEIEDRSRIAIIEVIELAKQKTRNKGNAYELANKALERVARSRRVEIGFRY